MNVLSLFDGCGMAYQAMKNLGMNIERYYASEIDKYAIQICKKNHPDVIQLGDIKNISGEDYKDIDLIIGGFPCQSFSIAGKRLNFDDPRGQLFFHAKRIIDEIKPKYFILENVASMRKDIQNEISRILGVEPIMINASLVSAQNRRRLFWTNIPGIEQPEDQKIYLKDILENEVDEKYHLSEKVMCNLNFGNIEIAGTVGYKRKGFECDKAAPLTQRDYKGINSWGQTVVIIKEATKKGYTEINPGECFDYTQPNSKTRRGRKMVEKYNCLTTGAMNYMKLTEDYKIRKLTPIECERLQCLPDNYTKDVSDTQRYKMIGNGFNVKVIEHILRSVNICTKKHF